MFSEFKQKIASYNLKLSPEKDLEADPSRVSVIPLNFKYSEVWNNYMQQKKSYWVEDKIIGLETDAHTFKTLPSNIQNSIKLVLAFFAGSDEIVARNIEERFIKDVGNLEISKAYRFQAMMEDIHSIMYNLLTNKIVDPDERDKINKGIKNFKSVTAKAQWAEMWISSDMPYSVRLIAFACVEGIMFSSSFAFIDWIKDKNYDMPALTESNSYISRDEARHTELACIIYKNHIQNKPTEEVVRAIIDSAIEVELTFISEVIPESGYNGMNRKLMEQHVRHVASILASNLGYKNLYTGTSTPFLFMNNRGLIKKDNFFERSSDEYTLGSVNNSEKDSEFNLDASF